MARTLDYRLVWIERIAHRLPLWGGVCFGLAVLVSANAAQAQTFDHRHTAFSKQLSRFVDRCGCVHYGKWQRRRQGLDAYLSLLGALSEGEYDRFTAEQKKALWLNAYNAMAVAMVLSHYPIDQSKLAANKPQRQANPRYPVNSIRQIPNAWEAIKQNIAGRQVSLYEIEHLCLRRDLRDVRCQFAVVPATVSGARLQRRAYTAANIDRELKEATDRFMADPTHLAWDEKAKTITVSSIFRWFPLDFLTEPVDPKTGPPADDDIVRQYVRQFLPASLRLPGAIDDFKVIYRDYDWALNECLTRGDSIRAMVRPPAIAQARD